MQFRCDYQTDTRRTIGVLQQWQVLLAPPYSFSVTEVTLADVQTLLGVWQQVFGPTATLEAIIQHLVGQDLREQVEQRQTRGHLAETVA